MRNFSGSQVVYNCVYDTHNIKVSSVKRTWSVAQGRGWKPVTIWIVAASYHYVASCLPLRNCVTTVDDRGKILLVDKSDHEWIPSRRKTYLQIAVHKIENVYINCIQHDADRNSLKILTSYVNWIASYILDEVFFYKT